jgi:hypothetical protein
MADLQAVGVTLGIAVSLLYPDEGAGYWKRAPQCYLPPTSYPLKMTLYDPVLGGWNCDDDCTTVATGKFYDSMYKQAASCPIQLLGNTINIDHLGKNYICVDTGPAVKPTYWKDHCITWLDVVWPLHREPLPDWTYWEFDNWSVIWEPWLPWEEREEHDIFSADG